MIDYATIQVSAGSAFVLPAVSGTIEATSFTVSGGSTLSLPGVTSYSMGTANAIVATLRVTGSNSLLDLQNVTSITGSTNVYSQMRFEAAEGGRIVMRRLATVTDPVDGDTIGRSTRFSADGLNSQIDLPLLTTIVDRSSFGNIYYSGYSAIVATHPHPYPTPRYALRTSSLAASSAAGPSILTSPTSST